MAEYRDAVGEHRHAVRREAGDELVGQGPERGAHRRRTSSTRGTTRRQGGRGAHGRVIVEGFIEFDYEITLLTVRHARTARRFCEPIGHLQVDGDYRESGSRSR